MYNSNDIAEMIKRTAKIRNISVKDLLIKAKLGPNTMNNFKTSMPKSDNLAKIADILCCSVDYLLGRSDLMEISSDQIPEKEKRIISAYRNDPDIQSMIDRLLKIEEPTLRMVSQEEPAKIAAFDGDNDTVTPQGTYQERKVLLKKIEEKQNNNKE